MRPPSLHQRFLTSQFNFDEIGGPETRLKLILVLLGLAVVVGLISAALAL